MTRRGKATTLLAAAAVTAGAAGWAWHKVRERVEVAAHGSTTPDTSGRPAELTERLRLAEEKAGSVLGSAEGLAELSRLYHANGFYDEALRAYEGLRQVEPHEARWPHLAACILANYGRLEEAAPLYRETLDKAPDYLPARLRLGDVALKANELAVAERAYASVLEQRREEPYALLGLARCAITTGEWEKARGLLERALSANPDFVGGMSLLAAVQEHLGENEAAEAMRARMNKREHLDAADPWLESLFDDCYDPYRLSVAAALAGFRGENATAERYLLRAIAYARSPAAYYRQLANVYVGMQNLPAAKRAFERATALAPTDSDAWALYVKLLNEAGERVAAYRAVVAGLGHCPESAALHYAHGHMLHEDGRLPQALAELQQAKRLRPSEANAYLEVAAIRFKRGEVEEGLNEMRSVLAVQPDHPAVLPVLAGVAIERGNEAEAREWIARMRGQARIGRAELEKTEGGFRRKFGAAP